MREMRLRILAAVGVVVVGALVSGADVADEDGSRMRAPQIEVPSSHADTLAPPADKVDWRYVALESPTTLSVTLKVTTEGDERGEAGLKIRRASGDTLFQGKTADGKVGFEESLEPGILYIGVSSESSLSYKLTVGE
jgi:hypothetical protein